MKNQTKAEKKVHYQSSDFSTLSSNNNCEKNAFELTKDHIPSELKTPVVPSSSVYATSCSNISTSYNTADITTYPSMVTHWIVNPPVLNLRNLVLSMAETNKLLKDFLANFGGKTSENHRMES